MISNMVNNGEVRSGERERDRETERKIERKEGGGGRRKRA